MTFDFNDASRSGEIKCFLFINFCYVTFDFNDASRANRDWAIALEYSAFRAARGLARNPISSEQSIF